MSHGVPTGAKPGKILVIDFFSTICAPCIAELPEIAAVRSDLSSNDDIEFVLVASDRSSEMTLQSAFVLLLRDVV